ncbi:sugar ABC transporter permease [Cohnella panacarvi]|uniref:sugar ABC transporter permease n=1 Tax=Cohnella panacarvi TaxID=400776 RepID=UPI00047C95E8|nr:sugar ABC transporter permease [Cohnella panacarvi]
MKPKLLISYAVLALIGVVSIYPALWTVLSSFRVGNSLFSDTFIPQQWTLDHYKDLFRTRGTRDIQYAKWFWNTLQVAAVSTVIGTILQLLTAYAFSRFRFKGRKPMMMVVLILGMFPGFLSIIAIFSILQKLQLLDSKWGLVLVYSAGSALGMFVAKGFFDTIPRSLEEAARIDGANNMSIFFRIILPLSRPIITYISLMTFTGAWVDFIFARAILTSRDEWTLAVGLWSIIDSYNSTEFTLFAAGCVLVAIPITILYMYTQRFLVDGLTAGASKG